LEIFQTFSSQKKLIFFFNLKDEEIPAELHLFMEKMKKQYFVFIKQMKVSQTDNHCFGLFSRQ